MKKTLLTLLIALVAPLCAQTDLLWPLGIEISQSSSFAEFRGLRFHAGIDLRTQRQTGFPVRAIADGFISRIKVQFRGYGYALYIDHPDLKKRVVYGHLQDFKGPAGDYVRKKLRKIGQRFGIDDFFGPDRFPVKKGQVVGISGETGSGPPHLHFEVRNLADEPEAPALIGFRPEDRIFPVLHHFYLEPMSFPCEINRSFLPYKGKIRKKTTKIAELVEKPEVCGKVGTKIGVSDNNGLGNVFGVESIKLLLNEEPLLQRKFHRYSYGQSSQCSLVYDYVKSNLKGTGYVVNMFKLPGETLPFSSDYRTWSGLIDTANYSAASRISFEISDFGHNQIELHGKIEPVKINYDRVLPAEIADGYKFGNLVTTNYFQVIIGDRIDKKPQAFMRGKIEILTADRNMELLPCLINGKTMEIAFPITKKWQSGGWLNKKQVLPETVFVDHHGGMINSEKGGEVEFGKDSIAFPVFAQFKKKNLNPPMGGNKKSGWLKPFSAVWKLEPENVVFSGEARLKIKPENYPGNLQKLGIYSVSTSGRYSHSGEKVVNGWLTAETRVGGEWVILEDSAPPLLTYLGKGKDYHLGKIWKFRARDLGKGVDYLGAKATVNGDKAEVYSDPDKAEIYVVSQSSKKALKLVLKVPDNAGNVAEITKKF